VPPECRGQTDGVNHVTLARFRLTLCPYSVPALPGFRVRNPRQWKPDSIGKEGLDRFLELRGLIEHHPMRRGAYPDIGDLRNGCILLAKNGSARSLSGYVLFHA